VAGGRFDGGDVTYCGKRRSFRREKDDFVPFNKEKFKETTLPVNHRR